MKSIYLRGLTLRPFLAEDIEAIHAIMSDDENAKYLLLASSNIADTTRFVENGIQCAAKNPVSEYYFAVVSSDSTELIGWGSIEVDISSNEAELGWTLHKRYWRKGFGTQIANALIRYGFEELNLRRLYAVCDGENHASFKLMQKCGMRKEGHFVKSRFHRGEYKDELFCAVLREEWQATQEPCK